jgi:hypothetical protein
VKRRTVQAAAGQRLVLLAIAGLLGGGAVEASAVGFDDQVQGRPVEVDPVAAESRLRIRHRQSGPSDDWQETALELGFRQAERLAVEDAAQAGSAAARFLGGRAQAVRADEVELVGFVDRGLEAVLGPGCG